MRNSFRYFNSSPEVIRLTVMMYIRYPLSFRQIEDLLFERGIDICQETVRFWWIRFGPMFAAEIRKRRVRQHRDRSTSLIPSCDVADQECLVSGVWPVAQQTGRELASAVPSTRMAKFRNIKTLQKAAAVRPSIHNHFHQDRHLNRRQIYKQNRSAAPAEWRQLAA